MADRPPVVWVALLNKTIREAADADGKTWKVSRFSVRPWQHWVHTYGVAELWLWMSILGYFGGANLGLH